MRSQSFRPHVDPRRQPVSFDMVVERQQPVVSKPQVTTAAKQTMQPTVAAQPSFQRMRTPAATSVKPEPTKHLPRQSRSHVLKRQQIKKIAKLQRARHRRPIMPTLLTGMALLLFMAGIFVLVSTLRTDHTVKAQVKQLAKQSDDEGITDGIPSEDDPPINLDNYNVAPDLPRYFSIEKLGIHARVKRLGVSADNVLKAPANIFDVGWYDGSAKPGENGTVVLDGHVSGPTKHGVFYSIGSLNKGDKVQLERGDGKVLTYTVTSSQVYDYDKVDMPKVLTTSEPGKPGLNFMTCTGRFNVRTNSFEQRIVVFTTQD